MRQCNPLTRLAGSLACFALAAVFAAPALAAPATFTASLDGSDTGSPGVGFSQVDFDLGAHTMRVYASFSGLLGTTTASHIHGPTAVAGTGTAGVATVTPSFTGFPLGVTSGVYDHTYDMTLAGSYNPSFITANGGTPASAEAALYQALVDGKAYLNIHSTQFAGGEIRGFYQLMTPTPTRQESWGRIKSLYR